MKRERYKTTRVLGMVEPIVEDANCFLWISDRYGELKGKKAKEFLKLLGLDPVKCAYDKLYVDDLAYLIDSAESSGRKK